MSENEQPASPTPLETAASTVRAAAGTVAEAAKKLMPGTEQEAAAENQAAPEIVAPEAPIAEDVAPEAPQPEAAQEPNLTARAATLGKKATELARREAALDRALNRAAAQVFDLEMAVTGASATHSFRDQTRPDGPRDAAPKPTGPRSIN